MNRPRVLLVNPNRMCPPIAPIGLEYVASDLVRNGYEPVLCDLTFAEDWHAPLHAALADAAPLAVGVSIRNLDDTFFASQDFILEATTAMIREIQSLTDAPVVLGGIGYSFAPRETLAFTGADYGIAGDGEGAFPALLERIAKGAPVDDLPGVVYRASEGSVVLSKHAFSDLASLPAPRRRFLDNPRYFAEGGQAGIETKRGCGAACTYCGEPIAKGARARLRSPQSIVEEIRDLVDQGINVFHLCDCEFNLPYEHALNVSNAIAESGLASSIRWFAYLSPLPFDVDLARTMARAGCAGINFGADHSEPDMLKRLGRSYGPEQLHLVVNACREAGLAVMLDMLFGSPGETKESIARAIAFVKELNPDCIGLSCGVRIYPHTKLAHHVLSSGPLDRNPHLHGNVQENADFLKPIFYVEAELGLDIHRYVSTLVGGDKRFFHTDPSTVDGNYNYNDNSVLTNAIRDGQRGAYWNILRQLAE